MSGTWKIVLSAVLIALATASSASARSTYARCRMLPAGPEWYADDLGCWHSIRADWAGIERRVRARRLQASDNGNTYQQ